MLRTALLVFAVLLALVGLGLRLNDDPAGTPMAIWGTVLTVAVLVERWRYHPPSADGAPQWQKTDERFVDPESGRLVEVWFSEQTGERRYVATSENELH